MIAHLCGTIRRKAPEGVVIDVGGVGYRVRVPLSTFYGLGGNGDEVALRIYTHVRDDAIELYGFRTGSEQRIFEALIGISGIGPKLAVTILSGIEPDALAAAIAEQDVARLTTIPGVGKKTAERIALELNEKVMELVPSAVRVGAAGARDDVLSALVNLGYKRRDAEAALERVDAPDEDFESLLRQTLKVLAR